MIFFLVDQTWIYWTTNFGPCSRLMLLSGVYSKTVYVTSLIYLQRMLSDVVNMLSLKLLHSVCCVVSGQSVQSVCFFVVDKSVYHDNERQFNQLIASTGKTPIQNEQQRRYRQLSWLMAFVNRNESLSQIERVVIQHVCRQLFLLRTCARF